MQSDLELLQSASLDAFEALVVQLVQDAKDLSPPHSPTTQVQTVSAQSLVASLRKHSVPSLDPAPLAAAIRRRASMPAGAPLAAEPALADPATAQTPEGAMALALAQLLEEVDVLLQAKDREPSPSEWMAVGRTMQTIADLAARYPPVPAPLAIDTSRALDDDDDDDLASTAPSSATVVVDPTPKAKLALASKHGSMRSLGSTADLDRVLAAIDRVQAHGAVLATQSVALSSTQQDRLDLAAAQGTVRRLARGRLEDQRAERTSDARSRVLDAVAASAEHPHLGAQRAVLTPAAARRLDLARLGAALDRLARLDNQDATTRADRLADLVARFPPDYADQRVVLSETQQRGMFLDSVAHRMARASLVDQRAAGSVAERKERAFVEVDEALDRMYGRGAGEWDGQRCESAASRTSAPRES
ncbi:hypothetical protein AMAG_11551 [Allomyces macrogynus ATCC 38327]|uniref:Uncharacterized protein n=1 Tax=Allomyces macrogynus (strain ATCC 38327) TaxID=578462 RepID=A0A0L0SVJ0_ALLM3|nr:hypothetical protein AMAG_11551 [Allomyces macrogynus ATCC 38327]|eukprot:KNE66410.1 hypothetical protein AMAG_11551 [Allomyces macrogynus ATCC 38327]